MADPNLTRALEPAQARRLLAAACENIRGLEAELQQTRDEKHQLAALASSPLAVLSQRIARLRNKVLPPGSSRYSFIRWVTGRSRPRPIVTDSYLTWIQKYETPAFAQLPPATAAAPCIHFILNGDGAARQTSLQSLLAQTDPNWRLCEADNEPTDGYIAMIRPGDQLAPVAVAAFRSALEKEPRIGMIYSDEDLLDASGRRYQPVFKPDWSPETFRALDYIGNLTAFALPLVREVGGFRPELGDAAVYDLALRVTEKTSSIHHTPMVLYHGTHEPHKSHKTQAVQELLPRPLISIIIPSKDQPRLLERCVESLLTGEYPNKEIVLVNTGSLTPQARAVNERLASRPDVRLLHWDQPFNYSAVNNFAVRQARGEVLTFLNDDTEVITPDWLDRLLEHAHRPNVGAVGAKLLYSDNTIQHAGLVLGIKNLHCGHLLQRAPDAVSGYPLGVVRNVSAVTGACLMMRRSVFDEVGGFEEQFAGDYNDVDLCLRVGRAGYQVIWTPHARLFHHECQTRGHIVNPKRHTQFAFERLLFLDRWGAVVERGDPFYNPNLNHDAADGTLRR